MRLGSIFLVMVLGCGEAENASSSASTPSASVDIGNTIGMVGGQPIGSKSFAMMASRKRPADNKALSMDERKEVFDDLVIEELLYQKALAKGLDKDPKVKKVMVNALLREEVYGSVKNGDFTDAELQAYFEEHKSDFTVPAKVQLSRILIKVTDARPEAEAEAKAQRLYAQLRSDISKFSELAKENSEDPYKRRGGDVGYVPASGKPGLDSAIVEKAFEMKVETLSAPFKTSDGFNIIYVPAKREAQERSFDKLKGSVLRKVKSERIKQMYDQYTGNLKSGAQVSIDEAALQAVEVKTAPRPMMGMPGGMGLGGMTPKTGK